MESILFEPAIDQDWPAIWEIFQATVGPGDTFIFAPDTSETDARAGWMFNGEDRRTYVARLDGLIVGSAYLKPNHVGLGNHIANAGWMIASAVSGRGIGRKFAEYVLSEARAMGFRGMQFNAVVASNHRAVNLWKSLGFEVIGTIPNAFRHSQLGFTGLHIMYRDL